MEFKTLTSGIQDEEEFELRCAQIRHAMEEMVKEEIRREGCVLQADMRLKLHLWFEGLPDDISQWQIPAAPLPLQPVWRGAVRRMGLLRWFDLIIDTQRILWHSAADKMRAKEPDRLWASPCWELRRSYSNKPRKDWERRWWRVGGQLYGGRIIAPVDSPLWAALGDSRYFKDAMDTETPPFALGSLREWRAVPRRECVQLGVPFPDPPYTEVRIASKPPPSSTPDTSSARISDNPPPMTVTLQLSPVDLDMPLAEALERIRRKRAAKERGDSDSGQPPESKDLPND